LARNCLDGERSARQLCGVRDATLLGTPVVMVLIVGTALHGFRQQQERNAALNRAVDEQNSRTALIHNLIASAAPTGRVSQA